MTHIVVPKVADYRERIGLYFDDRIIELTFPAPYLNNHPARLVVRQWQGGRLETREIKAGFGEAFVREPGAFWDAIVLGAPVRNGVLAVAARPGGAPRPGDPCRAPPGLRTTSLQAL